MGIYESLQDKDIIKKVNVIFYDKIYEHPWISQYFQAVEKEFIVQQQTDFIISAMGGPKNYSGRFPYNAHPHMHITDELFDLRQSLLSEALEEAQAPDQLKKSWQKIDEAFRKAIVKNDVTLCEKRWGMDTILSFPNPQNKKKAA